MFRLGLVLGSFFYGYWVLQIPGAWLALKIGGTRVFGYGVLLTSLLAILTPIAARYHVMALIGVRIFQGLFLVRRSITDMLLEKCLCHQSSFAYIVGGYVSL